MSRTYMGNIKGGKSIVQVLCILMRKETCYNKTQPVNQQNYILLSDVTEEREDPVKDF